MDNDRIGDFYKVCKEADIPVDDQLFSAGSPPGSPSFKPGGDLDVMARDPQAYYRFKKAARQYGLKVATNGNSITIESHEVTMHLPDSKYSNPTSAANRMKAMASDMEAAEGYALGSGTTIPHGKGAVRLERGIMNTPIVAIGDFYKKGHEADHFLKGPYNRQKVIESLNFGNKAAYKASGALKSAGINPGMSIHRMNLAELDELLGNRTGQEAIDFARQYNRRTFQQLGEMRELAAAQSAKDIATVRQQIQALKKAGNYREATALRQQLNTTREQVQRVAELSGRKSLVSEVFSNADDVGDATSGKRGAEMLRKLSKNLEKVTPALKKLGAMLVKAAVWAGRLAQVYEVSKMYDRAEEREAEWARRIGRDPSTGGIAKEFLFEALGFHQSKLEAEEALRRAGKDPNEMLTWDFMKHFVMNETDYLIKAYNPLVHLSPTERFYKYLRDNPDAAKQLLGKPVAPKPLAETPSDIPLMVAASVKGAEDDGEKEGEAVLPPMIAASLKKDEAKDDGKPKASESGVGDDAEPSPMVAVSTGKKEPEPEAEPEPAVKPTSKSEPAVQPVGSGFNSGRNYAVKAIALDLESRMCPSGTSSARFEGVVQGSEMTVIVRQDGVDYVISGQKAQYLLVRNGYIRNQKNCGYVTTGKYKQFGPGITQGGNEGAKKSHGECVEQYCPGCVQDQLLGVGFGHSRPQVDEGEVRDTRCADCLEANRDKINACTDWGNQ
ncbi:hypothetical protein [Desulfovibrio sp. Fe33]|uniref:hypothetical protein n=1 Tax=Desulfovibrio sp. Fe33 TaxID=3020842 RepID=UPI00234D9112|nr:hypothetical protein [Desulfovibrio sp. Fe33]